MNIREFIQRKKEEHFLYRDSDKLALQKASLEKERKALQARRDLENSVRKEQKAVRDLRNEPVKRQLAGIRSGFQTLQKNAERVNKSVSAFSNPDVKSPFSSGVNPFGPDKKKEEVKNPKTRTVVINIKE